MKYKNDTPTKKEIMNELNQCKKSYTNTLSTIEKTINN